MPSSSTSRALVGPRTRFRGTHSKTALVTWGAECKAPKKAAQASYSVDSALHCAGE